MRLRKYTRAELEKIVANELREREHDNTLLANASRQELAASHATRDKLRLGPKTDMDARLELPDYQVSLGQQSFILGEFKTAIASEEFMKEDYIKLVIMGKKAVDSLFKAGYPQPVVLIHRRGMDVDIYKLVLRAEAIYQLDHLGTFSLISNSYQFSMLLGLGPLKSARAIKSRNKAQTDAAWMRGTFDAMAVKLE
ncbi:hypothetical protein BGZ76_002182 [Entomortierella beljakovae]|nr:hypothetical protein BGZ76_002182 [Entomortierella beljakovae]